MLGDTAALFDPRLCPLLQGLTTAEQLERMSSDPRIAACIAALQSGDKDALDRADRIRRAQAACSSKLVAPAASSSDEIDQAGETALCA